MLIADAPNPSCRDRVQAAALRLGIRIARALGPVAASNIGGRVARTIGPWLPVSRVARANLRRALPELDARARRRVLLGVWENLGRTVAELPHIGSLRRTAGGPGWECEDDTELCALRDHGGPAILFSGHLANWDIGLPVAASLGLACLMVLSGCIQPGGGRSDPGHATRGDGGGSADVRQRQCRRTRGIRASAARRHAGHACRPEAERRPCRAVLRTTGDDHAGSRAVRHPLPLPRHRCIRCASGRRGSA
jgi:Bacterial lipid A biosynthesis acyltransferase